MDVTLRPFAGWDDLAGMRRLVAEGLRDAPDRSYVHPGDVSWWIGWSPVAPEDLGTRCRIWQGDARILGWAFVDGDDVGEFVHPEVLDTPEAAEFWGLVDAWLSAEHPEAARYASPSDRRAVDRLRDAGYQSIDDGLIAFRRSLDDAALAPTTRVHALRRDDDPTGRLRITRGAFGDERPFDRYLADYRRFMASPAYPEGWDLVAETDDGTAAACCIAWPDPISGSGNFEPVATHPDHTRRGFATAVMTEGLRRLRDAGMTWAIVRTPFGNSDAQSLYRSIGFEEWRRDGAFRRDARS